MAGRRRYQQQLRVFFFSDWRSQSLGMLHRLLDEAGPVDLILYGGDDVARFGRPLDLTAAERDEGAALDARGAAGAHATATARASANRPIDHPAVARDVALTRDAPLDELPERSGPPGAGNEFSRLARRARHGLAGVIGNDCAPHDRRVLAAPGARDLHAAPLEIDGWGFLGCEGAADLPGVLPVGPTLHSDGAIAAHLDEQRARLDAAGHSLVVASHAPPAGCLDTGIRFGLNHLGTPALARFVGRYAPAAVLCGHVHSQGGRNERMGRTLVANAACDDARGAAGRAALIDLIPGEGARMRWLVIKDSVTTIPGVGWLRAERLESVGLAAPDDVFAADDATLARAGFYPREVARLRLSGVASAAGCPTWYADPPTLPDNLVFYDVETGIAVQEPWMVGASIEGDDEVQRWVAPDEEEAQRRAMFAELIDLVRATPDAALCSWSTSNFDPRSVARGLARWAPDLAEEWARVPQVNLLLELRRRIALPVGMDWSLDRIARWCGYPDDADEEATRLDGMAIGLAYDRYLLDGKPLPMTAIARKNARDVRALAHIARLARRGSLPASALRDADVPLAAILLSPVRRRGRK